MTIAIKDLMGVGLSAGTATALSSALDGDLTAAQLMGAGVSAAQANAVVRLVAGTGSGNELLSSGFSGPQVSVMLGAANPPVTMASNRSFPNSVIAGGAATSVSYIYKQEFDSDTITYARVCQAFATTTPVGPWAGWIAFTDTMSKADATHQWAPRVNDTAYSQQRANATSPGWAQLTWNGATTVSPVLSSITGLNFYVIAASDWIPITVLSARSDGGTYPCLMAKIRNNAANANALTGNYVTTAQGAGNFLDASAEPFFRMIQSGNTSTDVVTNPATNNAAVVNNSGGAMWIEVKYSIPARSIAFLGDSTSEPTNPVFYFNSNHQMAIKQFASSTEPIGIYNGGMSGKKPISYMQAQLVKIVSSGLTLTDVFIQTWSVNQFTSNSQAEADDLLVQVAATRDYALGLGMIVWLDNHCMSEYSGGTAAAMQIYRANHLTAINAMVAAGGGRVRLVDTDSVLTDKVTDPAVYRIYAADTTDGIHLNATGNQIKTDIIETSWLAYES